MYKRIMANSNNSSGGSAASGGLITILQAAFIICKIIKANVIGDWPWWKVMLPLICSAGLVVLIFCCGVSCICCIERIKNKENANNDEIRIEHVHGVVPIAHASVINKSNTSGEDNV